MSHQISFSNSKLDKAMTQDQFNQIVEAILAGKYSWACVLILRFGGYNPLHYIPYRTYNRLLKENCQVGNTSRNQADNINTENKKHVPSRCLSQIKDLAYLEVMSNQKASVRGGNYTHWLDWTIDDDSSADEWLQISISQHFSGENQ